MQLCKLKNVWLNKKVNDRHMHANTTTDRTAAHDSNKKAHASIRSAKKSPYTEVRDQQIQAYG
jgi:hypothetical protein